MTVIWHLISFYKSKLKKFFQGEVFQLKSLQNNICNGLLTTDALTGLLDYLKAKLLCNTDTCDLSEQYNVFLFCFLSLAET